MTSFWYWAVAMLTFYQLVIGVILVESAMAIGPTSLTILGVSSLAISVVSFRFWFFAGSMTIDR